MEHKQCSDIPTTCDLIFSQVSYFTLACLIQGGKYTVHSSNVTTAAPCVIVDPSPSCWCAQRYITQLQRLTLYNVTVTLNQQCPYPSTRIATVLQTLNFTDHPRNYFFTSSSQSTLIPWHRCRQASAIVFDLTLVAIPGTDAFATAA